MKNTMVRTLQKMGALILSTALVTGCTGAPGGNTQEAGGDGTDRSTAVGESDGTTSSEDAAWRVASVTPYGRYPETVVYTLAKLTTDANSNLPQGDTYENNAYTRLLNEVINVQNEDIFQGSGETYNNGISMMIATGQMADIMVVSEEDMYELQEKDMLEDLTDAFENCASSRIKEIYGSYGDHIFDSCTFDGQLMAIPETEISNGPNLFWVRKDYLDALGLQEPETLEDVMDIAKAFTQQNIGCTQDAPNIGLACSTELVGGTGTSSEFVMDLVFAAYEAYPKKWVIGEDGTVRYGSVEPEAKEALQYLQQLYADGIIDRDFLIRTWDDIAGLIAEGRCGAFFAPWWAPNNPLWSCYDTDPEAEWVPYLIANGEDGKTRYCTQKMTGNYIVVRKGYEHPEVVTKILSVMFDYMRYSYEDPQGEFQMYYQINVDPTARPLAINVDYKHALDICYDTLCDVLSGELLPDELPLLEKSYYELCSRYLESPENANTEEWSGYTSRITACALVGSDMVEEVEVWYPRKADAMSKTSDNLEELELEVYLKIIRGEESIDAFDAFVENWYEAGGTEILEELQIQWDELDNVVE